MVFVMFRKFIKEKSSWCTLWDMYDSNLKPDENEGGQNESSKTTKDASQTTNLKMPNTNEGTMKKSIGTGTITTGTGKADIKKIQVITRY